MYVIIIQLSPKIIKKKEEMGKIKEIVLIFLQKRININKWKIEDEDELWIFESK